MSTIIHCRIPRSGRVQRTPQAAIDEHNAWLEARGISTLVFRTAPPQGKASSAAALSPYSDLHKGAGVSHATRDTNNRAPTTPTSDAVPGPAAKRRANKRRHDAGDLVAQVYHKGPVMVVSDPADLIGSKRRG
jgi:hypothetical protein